MKNAKRSMKKHWRSMRDLEPTQAHLERSFREFPEEPTELEVPQVDRRQFLGLMGATAALAGVGLEGCKPLRKPVEHIMPYTERPEDMVPGRPTYYASSFWAGGSVLGVLVESHEGRPTKVEGNPRHPMSLGATNLYAQAEVLSLYDNDRGRSPKLGYRDRSWDEAYGAFDTAFGANETGEGMAILVDGRPSPSLDGWLERVKQARPQMRVFRYDTTCAKGRMQALAMAGAPGAKLSYELDKAKVVLSIDADLFGTENDSAINAARFAAGRRVEGEDGALEMNRLYVVEPFFTTTGSNADNRLQIPASAAGDFLMALASALQAGGVSLAGPVAAALGSYSAGECGAWAEAVAEDLLGHRGESVIAVGERQPAWVHALGMALNEALGNAGETVSFFPNENTVAYERLGDFVQATADEAISTLLIIGGNAAYTAPKDMGVGEAIASVENSFHLSVLYNETSGVATWHLPETHPLETWLDLQANDGTVSIQQPLIEPLFGAAQPLEVVARIIGQTEWDAARLIREHWRSRQGVAGLHERWRRWLQSGVVDDRRDFELPPVSLDFGGVAGLFEGLAAPVVPTHQSIEVVFAKDYSVYDGRYANNPWLQELPDPITKVTWDNVAIVGPATADALGLQFNQSGWPDRPRTHVETSGQDLSDMITLTVGGETLEIAAWVTPGVAEGVVVLPIGYGRSHGTVAQPSQETRPMHIWGGFNTLELFQSANPEAPLNERVESWIHQGGSITKTGGTYYVATTQDHWAMGVTSAPEHQRPMVRENTLDGYAEHPEFVEDYEIIHENHINSLWEEPNPQDGQQWGMSIDLTTCTGCNVCSIACQAENVISVVSKHEVLNGREMHWIRLDRYFVGDPNEPEMVSQPVACMHCENAPCEQVCPVAATTHGPEGTNDMVYNRCVGTRYCANNCPYKVRRFNFFNFSRYNDEANPYYRLQKNPDVTVRFRGVIEKCTYCVQRINAAKIDSKVNADGVVPDGGIVVACQQACPTGAIVFGDVNDPTSRVSQLKARNRDYGMLKWLNTEPRTSYLAKIRNPNPALIAAPSEEN